MRMTKLRKYGIIFLVLLMALMSVPMAMAEGTADISTPEALQQAFKDGGSYKLTQNIEISVRIITSKDVVLDLNGFYISTDKSITVGDTVRLSGKPATEKGSAGSLVLNNSSETIGEIKINGNETSEAIEAIGDVTSKDRVDIPSTITINKGVRVISQGYYCVFASGMGATININDGAELQSNLDLDSVPILGNGQAWESGTKINIYGGIITGGAVSGGLAIYHPQEGTLNISGGELKGYDGIQFKSGTLKMTSGTITATGAHVEPVEFGNGSVPTGTAVSFISNVGYTGDMHVNISGNSILKSALSNGLHIGPVGNSTQRVVSVKIDGGSITGEANKKALNFANVEGVSIDITGGTYSSNPKEYVREPYVVKQTGNEYTVVRAGVVVTPATAELVLDLAPGAELTASSEITEDFTWASENESVVKVVGANNDKITVVGVGAGTANVTATGAISGSVEKCVVTVRKAAPVSVTPANMELKIGETGKVEAKYDAKDSVSWSSSNQAVATVKGGTVTAGKKAGVAIITAKGKYTSAACTLTVIDPVTPDPTPTPAPVDPGTVGKDKNPVNNEKDKPENVEAATPAIKEATEDAKDDISNTTNIKKENLVATANGTLTISPVLAKSALEEVMSADKEVAPKNVVLLPIVSTTVKAKNVAAMAFSMTGAQLGAEEGTVAGDVKIIKVLADGKGAQFSYASSAAGYQDETFTLKDANDKTLALTDKVVKTSDYKLIIFVADGGNFDLDKTPGSVVDPVAVATNAAKPTPHSSSSGCNAGFAGLLLLAAVPFIYRRKR